VAVEFRLEANTIESVEFDHVVCVMTSLRFKNDLLAVVKGEVKRLSRPQEFWAIASLAKGAKSHTEIRRGEYEANQSDCVLSPTNDLRSRIDEATRKTVGRYTARRDQPHFQGDEIHAHCELPGGKELSWTITGKRRHPKKFPADNKFPRDAKAAIADLLGVDPNILEAYEGFDEVEREDVFILERRKMARSEIEQEIRNLNLSPEEMEMKIKKLTSRYLC